MNRTRLKNYAPQARREFIQAMTDRAAFYGLTAKTTEPVVERGDVAVISGREHPRAIAKKRKRLEDRIKRHDFEQTMEALAYTWFNRLVAIRFMELHGYLDHGYRVLSHPEGKPTPEILQHAEHVELPGLNKDAVIDLKVAGNKEAELYRLLLMAQCNALNTAMPFLFERIDDETELLLPDNLLHSDSLIRKLVSDIDEADWEDVEIIGWLYQYYISEKKDQVIGKVVKSEDIPAATQLFTPNWIVKYMVQNSLGAQWLATYPQSSLKGQMEYYIEPAKQTNEVQAKLASATPKALNPEALTLIDPASGSGHILLEAYELFKAIYLERGYRQRDVAQLILEKNLFGLDIDERAAQLTGFALMMKARIDDRRLFERGVKLNVMAFVDSNGFDAERLAHSATLADVGLAASDLTELKRLFANARTFGSLIQVPKGLAAKLPALKQLSEANSKDLFLSDALERLGPLVRQAELLAAHYDAVVANPPYMGSSYQTPSLKSYLKDQYKGYAKDLFSVFMCRNQELAKHGGRSGFMTPMVWMFISSHEKLRKKVIKEHTLESLIHLEYNASGDVRVPLCTFVISKKHTKDFIASFIRLAGFAGDKLQGPKTLEAIRNPDCGWLYRTRPDDFAKIHGSPIGYWIGPRVLSVFEVSKPLGEIVEAKQGIATADNGRFIRRWPEVARTNVGFGMESGDEAKNTKYRWFPYNKGGDFRKWYGNQEYVVNWEHGGRELIESPDAVVRNPDYHFRESVSWSDVTSSISAFRWYPRGFLFDSTGHSAFPDLRCTRERLLCLCNNNFTQEAVRVLNPTLHFHVGYFNILPAAILSESDAKRLAGRLIELTRTDWNAYERSWDFQSLPILTKSASAHSTIEESYTSWITQNRETIAEVKRLEEENNRLFITAYDLGDEIPADVPIAQVTLTVNPAYRYGDNLPEEEQWARFRRDTMEELISYAIGCMMGRYSLAAPGLVYANSGNDGFDPSRYGMFRADDDGIIPQLETDWGIRHDATNRIVEFISVAWPKERLEENLTFLADSLGPIANERPRDTLRRYLAIGFYKHHLSMYKRRPIYWLFSSGKQRAFQSLVYLHRYHEGTLARMRTEYVIPLQGQIASRVEKLEGDKAKATSTSHRRRLQKEQDDLKKQQTELLIFEEKLKHAADQKISLNLDDGVKVNYGKFGDLLAEFKVITGGAEDE